MLKAIKIQKTAKVATYGNPNAKTVIVALHGYGQLVQYFIRKFHGLEENDFFVVAPEGLHRFYLKGASGRVGASWMTKEERETDIADYINYLNEVCAEFNLNQFEKRVLLGFSQGGATASRWMEQGDFLVDQFVLWGSVFPPDVALPNPDSKLNGCENHFFIGTNDQYFPEGIQQSVIQSILELNLNFEIHSYEGTHDVYVEHLLPIL